MTGLYRKLESQGLKDVAYMVVSPQGENERRLHPLLAEKLSENITLYKQEEQQPDVWQTLGGEKDDFFIYDRCGRLTNHISLPYSIIGQGHVESAIRDTYCKRICGECTHESAEIPEECKERADAQPDADANPPVEGDAGHGHHHDHGHGHGQGLGRGHHGHHGSGRDHDPSYHHGRNHDGHGRGHGQHQTQQRAGQQEAEISQGQDQLDLGQVQQAVHMHQMPQEALGGPGRP